MNDERLGEERLHEPACVEQDRVVPAVENVEPSCETGNATRKPIALFLSTLRETIERFAQRILKALTKPGLFMEPKTPEEQMLL